MHAPASGIDDTSPLLRSRRRQPQPLRCAAARFLRQASSRRMLLREPSVRVRENAAEELEERQSDWAYSTPIIALDLLWNLAFMVVAVVVLGFSVKESPVVPLRLWVIGYVLQCFFHVVCVVHEYRRRREERNVSESWGIGDSRYGSVSDGGNSIDYGTWQRGSDEETNITKQLESANTMFSFIWWIIGFYWVFSCYQTLKHDSPQLYWICASFLFLDVVFIIICIVIACLIGLAICCCLPCILGVLYAMADRVGATKEEIDQLPNFNFCRIVDDEKVNGEIQESFGGIMTECNTTTPAKRVLSHEDAECCICLSAYDDGAELRELPCCHHFHSMCIDKWLHINATCPLCKLNILKPSNLSGIDRV
ncbi:hypothetical protein K2173_024871 [Erythroxylum novogranatense]|uniref:RING-type E3 ubiquitin transferase n=1 Tax=Erythroxylum novogranatense TaxID=1862640 RepID=A0AAV8UCU2_9ROSI|nr:hypothetical protein K2173_024871 [Erythroxylum novogranatense]